MNLEFKLPTNLSLNIVTGIYLNALQYGMAVFRLNGQVDNYESYETKWNLVYLNQANFSINTLVNDIANNVHFFSNNEKRILIERYLVSQGCRTQDIEHEIARIFRIKEFTYQHKNQSIDIFSNVDFQEIIDYKSRQKYEKIIGYHNLKNNDFDLNNFLRLTTSTINEEKLQFQKNIDETLKFNCLNELATLNLTETEKLSPATQAIVLAIGSYLKNPPRPIVGWFPIPRM